MRTKLISPPAVEPVGLEEAKNFLRVTINDDNDLIARLITTARKSAEAFTKRSLIHQTWEVTLDAFRGVIRLPYPPIKQIEKVLVDGEEIGTSAYALLDNERLIVRNPHYSANPGAVKIQYLAGYGPTAEYVPEDIRTGILIILAALYENRGDKPARLPEIAREVLNPYRVIIV